MKEKSCSACKEIKSVTEFHKCLHYYQSKCKSCSHKQIKEWRINLALMEKERKLERRQNLIARFA